MVRHTIGQSDISIMKRFLLFFVVIFSFTVVFAQFSGDGYYRVKNRDTERYLTVIDDKASVNMYTNEPDLAAILPIRDFERIVGNPASIIYIDNVSGNNYSLSAQGVNTYDLMGVYLRLAEQKDGSYYAYAVASGLTKFLCDEKSRYDEGWLMTGTSERNWLIEPVSSSTDNYFGVVPEFSHDGAYYTTMYADFPYKAANTDTKIFYVELVKGGQAVIKEITDGIVPAGTPVIIQCASEKHVNNKLNVLTTKVAALKQNCLKGVYFNNSNNKHLNRVAYDKNTMRVLGLTKDGNLGFVTANIDYLPANKAYLTVPAGSPEEIKLVEQLEPEPGTQPEPETKFEILSSNPIEMTAEGGECIIKYAITNPKADLEVKFATDVNWVKLSEIASGENELRLVVDKNEKTTQRSATIFVTYDRTYTIKLRQAAATPKPDPVFEILTSTPMEFTAEGGNCTIKYSITNPDNELEVKATANVDWIVPMESTAGANELLFKIVKNEKTEARSGIITVSYDRDYEVVVNQAAGIGLGIQDMIVDKKNDVYFDLFGRRVLHPKKGIYVNSKGQKVIFK